MQNALGEKLRADMTFTGTKEDIYNLLQRNAFAARNIS